MHWQFGEMKFGEMKRNTSNWSNFGMLLRRAGLTASAGLSCNSCSKAHKTTTDKSNGIKAHTKIKNRKTERKIRSGKCTIKYKTENRES